MSDLLSVTYRPVTSDNPAPIPFLPRFSLSARACCLLLALQEERGWASPVPQVCPLGKPQMCWTGSSRSCASTPPTTQLLSSTTKVPSHVPTTTSACTCNGWPHERVVLWPTGSTSFVWPCVFFFFFFFFWAWARSGGAADMCDRRGYVLCERLCFVLAVLLVLVLVLVGSPACWVAVCARGVCLSRWSMRGCNKGPGLNFNAYSKRLNRKHPPGRTPRSNTGGSREQGQCTVRPRGCRVTRKESEFRCRFVHF